LEQNSQYVKRDAAKSQQSLDASMNSDHRQRTEIKQRIKLNPSPLKKVDERRLMSVSKERDQKVYDAIK
jgi:hypothetical protein